MTDNRMKALWWGIILLLVVVAGASAAALGLDTLYRTSVAPFIPQQTGVPGETLPPPPATPTHRPSVMPPTRTATSSPFPTPTPFEVDPRIYLWQDRHLDFTVIAHDSKE